MAEDIVLTPGGYRSRSKVHLIEPTHTLRQDGLNLKPFNQANTMVTDFGSIAPKAPGHPLMPHNVVTHDATRPGSAIPDLGTGWIVYAD